MSSSVLSVLLLCLKMAKSYILVLASFCFPDIMCDILCFCCDDDYYACNMIKHRASDHRPSRALLSTGSSTTKILQNVIKLLSSVGGDRWKMLKYQYDVFVGVVGTPITVPRGLLSSAPSCSDHRS